MVIPHQANQRILDATAERLGLPPDRMASVIARYGNTTAATLPLALDAVLREGRSRAAICGPGRGGSGIHGGIEPDAVAVDRGAQATPRPFLRNAEQLVAHVEVDGHGVGGAGHEPGRHMARPSLHRRALPPASNGSPSDEAR